MPTNILIIDDHPAVLESLVYCIAKHPEYAVCGQAKNAQDAFQLYLETKPDFVVTDITLKNGDSLDLIKRMKAHDVNALILVWSMHAECSYAERALSTGARGYITKEHGTEQVFHAMREILAGRVYLSSALKDKLLSVASRGASKRYQPLEEQLTSRELDVFRLIGQGLKTQEIAERLGLNVKTIETHRDRIKKKLDMKDATDLLRGAVLWDRENR